MTEPVIEQTEAEIEVFSDELSDEALDRTERADFVCLSGTSVCACLR
jgi:hypothetical protein